MSEARRYHGLLEADVAIPRIVVALVIASVPCAAGNSFDHSYAPYAALLNAAVRGARVDYRALVARRHDLDRVVREIGAPSASDERGWPRSHRLAFWINAYNLLTLKAVVDHYPVKGIREIDGVWTDLRFTAASRSVTLDDIEHRILRPEFKDPRIHFAINCASVSCPPLREEPYVAERIDTQLDDAARRYLASPLALEVDGSTLRVSSIFKWYGEDFVPVFGKGAILAVIEKYGPSAAQAVARSPNARTSFLPYDWSLNAAER